MLEPKFFRRYDYDRSLLPNKLLRKLERNVKDLESANTKTGKTIGYPGWGLIYHILLCHLHPDKKNIIIETGTNWGCSTIILAQAVKDSGCDGVIHTFEIGNDEYLISQKYIQKSGLKNYVNQVKGDSTIQLKNVLSDGQLIRFVFLDGSHLYEDVLKEFAILHPYLEPDALVVFDNTYKIAEEGEDPRVNGALNSIMENYGGNLINLEFVSWYTPGLAIWQQRPNL